MSRGDVPITRGDDAREPPLGHWLVDPRLAPRRDARRREILDAALALFNETGFVKTSIEDISIRAEASVGSIYHHFGKKEGIAVALYVEGLAGYQHGLLRELAVKDRAAEETIRAIVAHHLRWVEGNKAMAQFLLTDRDASFAAASESALELMNENLFTTVGHWIDRWAEAGAIRKLPFGLFHAVVLGPCQEFARHWVAGRTKVSIDEAERELADAAWKAVRA